MNSRGSQRVLVRLARLSLFPATVLSAVTGAAGAADPPATRPARTSSLPMVSPSSPKPLDPAPIIPDPVKLGGFVPKVVASPGTFLREGSFVFNRPARFMVDAEGKAVLQFELPPDSPKGARPPPPVYVLPNLKRMAIEDAIKGRVLPLIVSGTATEDDGRNYLLLDDSTHPAGPAVEAPVEAVTRPAEPARNQSADQLLGQLLRSTPGSTGTPLRWDKPPAADQTSGAGAVKPDAPAVTLIAKAGISPIAWVGWRVRRKDGGVPHRSRRQNPSRSSADPDAVHQGRQHGSHRRLRQPRPPLPRLRDDHRVPRPELHPPRKGRRRPRRSAVVLKADPHDGQSPIRAATVRESDCAAPPTTPA